MARLRSQSLPEKLQAANVIESNIWSITLFDGQHGILSLGGSIATDVEEVKIRTQIALDNIGKPPMELEVVEHQVTEQLMDVFHTKRDDESGEDPSWTKAFRWSPMGGSEGWWTTLMSGVWINSAKVLKNQPVLLDLQVPFILAPPIAVRTFYAGISGSKQLPEPYDMFYVFPCLNPPNIAFEFAGWLFPTMNGGLTTADTFLGPPGGRLSLGRVREGSGYCVGAVVGSRMGETDNRNEASRIRHGSRDSGLHNTWILGEPFFKGTGVAFDSTGKRIGFRSY